MLAVAALVIVLCGIFAAETVGLRGLVSSHGDDPSYLAITGGILGKQSAPASKHFRGLPYATAAVVALTRVSPATALYLICVLSSLAATWVVTGLWGKWVGVGFTLGNWTWIEFSSYGGSEPLFVLLLLLAIAQARRGRYLAAVLLASLATTVRPLGLFLVLVLLIAAWRERGLRWAVACAAAAAAIGLLYVAPLVREFHDPLLNLHGYQQSDWGGGAPVGLPLKAVVANYINGRNVGNLLIKHAKAAFVLLHLAALLGLAVSSGLRRRLAEQPVMGAFALVYSAFILCYNAPWWALSIYPRLLIPVLPFFLWLYQRWLPRTWRAWGAVGALSVVLACGAGLGFNRAWLVLHGRAAQGWNRPAVPGRVYFDPVRDDTRFADLVRRVGLAQ